MITRHFIDCGPNGGRRRVHYRRCGKGPPLLMVHQSPRSSAEYELLMQVWGQHFTCIAPDSPGFGQSDRLPDSPEINDFADATVEFLDALGITRCAAYGFHSGGIILVTALRRHASRFSCLALGGYAIWTPEEMAIFSDAYLPPFQPSAYGEHLTWLWNRILEQSWFFPWFDVRDEARLSVAHDDPARVHAVVMDMLDAGDAYRAGYGAVLRAPRDIPPVDAVTPPVLITAYDGDPLQTHIDRLGAMPKGWEARKVATAAEHQADSLVFLLGVHGSDQAHYAECETEGFLHIKTDRFDGLIHWRGNRNGANYLLVHAPGREIDDVQAGNRVMIDMPGHGLSDNWKGEAPTDIAAWHAVTHAARDMLGAKQIMYRFLPEGDPEQLFPDLTPDRYGHYLTKAWSIIRAGRFFCPWYQVDAAHAAAFEADNITPEALAKDHRTLLRARAAREMTIAYSSSDY